MKKRGRIETKAFLPAWGKALRALMALAVLSSLHVPSARAQNAFDDPSSKIRAGGGGGDLVPTVPLVDGGSVSIGATTQVVVLFRNDSGQPVTNGAIQLYPASTVSASVALNQCAQEALPPGGVCAVSLSVKGLSPGDWRVEMIMRHSGRARLATATVTGKVEGSEASRTNFVSDIEAIPSEMKFGNLKSSQSVVKGIVLRNTTSDPLDIRAVYIEASEQAGYSLKTDCERLDPGQACIVTVTWSPVLAGDSSGVLLIEHSGPTSVASIPLQGEYEPESTSKADLFPKAVPGKGLLVASQDAVDFGTGIGTTSSITVSLVNVGDAAIRLKDIQMASADNGLSIAQNGCQPGMVLEPVDACPLTVTWSPVRQGSIIDDVQITHDGARGVLVLPVRGSATAIISQDAKAVRLGNADQTATLEPGDKESAKDVSIVPRDKNVDPASVLDGFVITSHSPTRAIITGPGGSRIVFGGQEVVIGGFLWNVSIRPSGVEFSSGPDKVLLLFDRSLSSVNRVAGQSGGSEGSSSAVTAPVAAPPAATPTN